MTMLQKQQKSKLKCSSSFQASASIIFINVSLAKARSGFKKWKGTQFLYESCCCKHYGLFCFPTPTPIYYCLSSGHSYFILPTCKIALSLSGLSKVSWLWHQAQVQYYLIFIFCECKWKYLDAAPLDSELSKIKWHTQHLIVSQDQNNHNEQMAISELRRAHVASFTYYALQQ